MRYARYFAVVMLAVGLVLASMQGAGADEKKKEKTAALEATGAAQAHNAEGIAHYNQGHMDVAAGHFKAAVKADDKSAEAHYNLALALDGMGDHKAATQEFSKALELGAGNPEIAESGILKKHVERMKKH